MESTSASTLHGDDRWTAHRADADGAAAASAASTPAPTTPATPPADDLSSSQELPRAASSASPSNGLGIDAEDEDVRIAIMALGAMKSLDGSSNGFGAHSTSSSAISLPDAHKRSSKSPARTSSAISNSSVASTAISSPSSTPTTDLTQDSGADSPAGRMAGPARLGDLPPDLKLPAVIQDEDGNELEVDPEMMNDADFLRRVSHLPLVRGTLRAYELGKQRSKVVKYGAGLVESSVKSISRPVVSRLGASLGERGVEQLDDFACRQLDRLYPTAVASPTKEEKRTILDEVERKDQEEWQNMSTEEREKRRKAYTALQLEERERNLMANELRQRRGKGIDLEIETAHTSAIASGSASRASSGKQKAQDDTPMGDAAAGDAADESKAKDAQSGAVVRANAAQTLPFKNSRWGSMLVEAGATAGGLSAAMSEESMKSLKYCLQWLQYATAHIEHQITILRDLIVRLNHGELDMSGTAVQNLTHIKGDVVNTIRGVVDVIGKYAGSALPEPARNSVKAFILSLPARWATVNRSSTAGSPTGYFGSSPSSPSFSPAHISEGPQSPTHLSASARYRNGAGGPREQMQVAATAQAANRILTLAIESLDILRSVTVVFGESLDRADLWVERLRILGLQRKRAHEAQASEPPQIGPAPGSSSSLGAPQHWESARGSSMRSSRATSPGGDSDVSMDTSASTKRRRTRQTASGGFHMSRTPSAAASQGEGSEDDEALTETEKSKSPLLGGAATFSAGSAHSGNGSAPHHHHAHRRPGTRSRAGTGGKHYPMHPPTLPSPLHATFANSHSSRPESNA